MINRAKLRGKPLDRDCRSANRTTNEWGSEDDRVFCYGLENSMNDELFDKCRECGAYVGSATPLEGGK